MNTRRKSRALDGDVVEHSKRTATYVNVPNAMKIIAKHTHSSIRFASCPTDWNTVAKYSLACCRIPTKLPRGNWNESSEKFVARSYKGSCD